MTENPRRAPDSGLTLVEVLVAMALFSAIGIAGFSIVNAVLGVQARTEGRLDRLGDIQRALHLVRLDFEQAEGEFRFDGEGVSLRRSMADGNMDVTYFAGGDALNRHVAYSLDPDTTQRLLSGVSALQWRFYDPAGRWLDDWPPSDTRDGTGMPKAVALEFDLAPETGPPTGRIRRVLRLPVGIP